jgi:carboxymethylenebutenolidase
MTVKEIEIAGPAGTPINAYLAEPTSGNGHAVCISHDIFGMNASQRAIAELFADHGYISMVPDMFWDLEPEEGPGPDGNPILHYRNVLDHDDSYEAVKCGMAALKAMPAFTGKLGVIGFCVGGNVAYRATADGLADASASYYGTRLHLMLDRLPDITRPTLLHISEHDHTYLDEERDNILAAVEGHGHVTSHVYPSRHGFAHVDPNNLAIPGGLMREGPDGPDTSAFELEDFLSFRLVALARLVERQSKRGYSEAFGISVAEWRVLAILATFGDRLINELATITEYDKSQISRAVTALADRGYIQRIANPQDQRGSYLSLTDTGRALYKAALPAGRERQRDLLSLLSPNQRRELYTALDILTHHLKSQDPAIATATKRLKEPMSRAPGYTPNKSSLESTNRRKPHV